MATYNLHRFTRPEALKSIEPSRLIELLAPYREFFAEKAVYLPSPGGLDLIDFQGLVRVLASPDGMPDELLDTLWRIHELSTVEAMTSFLEDADLCHEVGDDATPADVAVLVWLRDRQELERKHAEMHLNRPRSFDYFMAEETGGLDRIEPRPVKELEAALDRWFIEHKRGRGCQVFDYSKKDEVWFLVRHGDPFRREGSLVDGEPSSVCYRPEKYDVLVYDGSIGELRMSARTKGERQLYRESFGLHLFGSPGHFPGKQKYTLEPLRTDGRAATVCSDVEGLDWIKLKEIHYFWTGSFSEIETHKADDIFAVLDARGTTIPEKPRIIRASFQVKFTRNRTPRSVAVRPPNVAQYTHDGDSELIEQWLLNRRFIRNGGNG